MALLARKVYDIDLAAWRGLWLHVHVHVYETEAYYHEYYVAGSRSALSSHHRHHYYEPNQSGFMKL